MKKGNIIILNGVTCSGKTTLAENLRERLSEPFYSFDIDTFCIVSERYYDAPDIDVHATPGRFITNKGIAMLPHTIKNFSDMGLNTIVEHIFLNCDKLLESFVELLCEYPVLFVHVTCQMQELLRREKKRTGISGASEKQLAKLIPQDTYDIIVDTYSNSSIECADKIIEMLNYPEKFIAFKNLWSQRT